MIRQNEMNAIAEAMNNLNAFEFEMLFGNRKHMFHGGVAWFEDGQWFAAYHTDVDGVVAKFDGSIPLKAVIAAVTVLGGAY
ncbi:MAG: hypothetical protein AB7E51_02280 [Pseudodesulfovibrio sp.]|uniref:hypothetical protein n=1 Tax=Pseudodesulfovibrio sp. TaxID=2035812 RepID=UPI003D0F1765